VPNKYGILDSVSINIEVMGMVQLLTGPSRCSGVVRGPLEKSMSFDLVAWGVL
jgi:hypothetical protein